MPSRAVLMSAVLALVTAVPAGAQVFRYAPDEAAFRATVETRVTREMGGQRMEDEITQQQRFRVSLRPQGADTLQIGITLDSASVVARTSGPQDTRALIGLKVEGLVSPLGAVYSSKLVHGDLGLAGPLIAGELVKLLPRMRGDLRAGLTWTDTTTEQVEMFGIPISRRTITVSKVEGDTAIAGQRAWRVNRTADVSFKGEGSVQGQAITLTGTSAASGHILVGHAGKYFGSSQRDSVTTNFRSAAMNISVTQTQQTRVSRAD